MGPEKKRGEAAGRKSNSTKGSKGCQGFLDTSHGKKKLGGEARGERGEKRI